jgi:hypothetical protein
MRQPPGNSPVSTAHVTPPEHAKASQGMLPPSWEQNGAAERCSCSGSYRTGLGLAC